MLRSLEIRNYRNLRHLTIEKLGRVNLLVGKNNTGKTSVLEAVALLIHKGNLNWITQIFEERGGINLNRITSNPEEVTNFNVDLLTDLFYGREVNTDLESSIEVNDFKQTSVTIRFSYYMKATAEDEAGEIIFTKLTSVEEPNDFTNLGLEVTVNNISKIINLNRRLKRSLPYGGLNDNVHFIRTNNISRDVNGRLWDKVTSTDKNIHVENALKLIEAYASGLRFILPSSSSYSTMRTDERIPVVQMKGFNKPIPLYGMGDGINRILTIILAMVNCENGYLLIDEFENGLHYSVQEKLWEIIFYLAERLNIQVFATTHSNDAIRSFTSVLAKQSDVNEAGKAIRLQMHNDTIRAVDYSPEELETASEFNIEVR